MVVTFSTSQAGVRGNILYSCPCCGDSCPINYCPIPTLVAYILGVNTPPNSGGFKKRHIQFIYLLQPRTPETNNYALCIHAGMPCEHFTVSISSQRCLSELPVHLLPEAKKPSTQQALVLGKLTCGRMWSVMRGETVERGGGGGGLGKNLPLLSRVTFDMAYLNEFFVCCHIMVHLAGKPWCLGFRQQHREACAFEAPLSG